MFNDKKAYTLLVVNTDKEARQLFNLINKEESFVMSLDRQDCPINEKYNKIIFLASRKRTGEEIELLTYLENKKCIFKKDIQIIHLEDIFNLSK